MIDVKLTTIGGPEIARQLEAGPGAIRAAVRAELAVIGDEIVSRAQALAPKRSGIMASKIEWYFGSETSAKQRRQTGVGRTVEADRGPVVWTVRPRGTVAHLIERGVKGPRKAHTRRLESTRTTVWTRRGERSVFTRNGKNTFRQATAAVKQHPFAFAARPFFMPAVESVGGSAGVGQRLQAAMATAGEMARGAA